jgi:branched-chain amino acid transport system permease protein
MVTFLQLLVQGIALGCVYALIALGFTVVLQAGVINFAHGSFMLLGAYIVSWLAVDLKIPFVVALALGAVVIALLGVAFEQSVLRRMASRPVFTVIMITLGLDIILRIITSGIWGYDPRPSNGDPFGLEGFNVGDLRLNWADIAIVMTTLILLALIFAFFKYTRYGIAMRAVATDHEAAAAIGISLPQIYAITWAIAGVVATLGGVFLAASPRTLDTTLGIVALRAFPAIILGGLGSTTGAVVGGLILGLLEVLVAGYQNTLFPWLGTGFNRVAAYVVLLIVLLVRPYGLFGQKEVERV